MSATNTRWGTSLLVGTLTLASGLYLAAEQPAAPPKDAPTKKGKSAAKVTFVPPASPFAPSVNEQVLTVAFSPDGKKLATAGAWAGLPGQLKVWDVASARELVAARGFPGLRSIAWSPDGALLASGDSSGAVRLRDPNTGAELAAAKGHTRAVNTVAISSDGKMLVSAGFDQVVILWDLARLQERKQFVGHTDAVISAAFFRHGRAFVTAGQDKTAKIWDVASGKEKLTLRGHDEPIEAVAISPDDKIVATAGWDKTIRLWNADTGAEKAKLEGQAAAVAAIAFSPDGKWLASASIDKTIFLWDVEKQKQVGMLGQHRSAVWALAFSRDGILASGSSDSTAKLWDIAGRKEIATLNTNDQKPIRALAYSPDARFVAVAKEDTTVQVCAAKGGNLLHVLRGHTGVVTCLTFSPDSEILATSADKTVRLWQPARWTTTVTLPERRGIVTALAYMPDAKKLAVGRDDGTVRWHAALSGEELETMKPDVGPIHALACAPDGRLAVGGDVPIIKIQQPAKPGEFENLPGHGGPIRALAFSSAGILASAGDDGAIKIWEDGQPGERFTLKGHDGPVLALAFSPTGQTLVSGGADGTVRQWNPRTGELSSSLRQHFAAVTTLAMHPGGADVLSGSKDTQTLRWPRAASGIRVLPLVFRHDFRGTPLNKNVLKLSTKDEPGRYAQEPEGLRISSLEAIPRGNPSGVMTPFGLRGDFDITASYEILKADIPTAPGAIGVSLNITTDTPTQDSVMLARHNRPDGAFYIASGKMTTPVGQKRVSPAVKTLRTNVSAGQLRLIRQGDMVRFLVADEGAEGFQDVRRVSVGTEDTLPIRFRIDHGNKDSPPVSARLRFIEVRGQPTTPVVIPAELAVKSPEKKGGKNPDKKGGKGLEKKSPPQRDYAQEYHQLFKDRLENIPNWKLIKQDSAPDVLAGADGLRITMPPGFEKRRDLVGVETDFGVKGDFDITMHFEILEEPAPDDTVGTTGLSLRLDLDEPTNDFVTLSRLMAPKGSRVISYLRNSVEGKGANIKVVPTKLKAGQLRLVRAGGVLSHYLAEEGSDDFYFVCEHPIDDGELKRISIAAATGGPKASLGVRISALHIRADAVLAPSDPIGTGSSIVGFLGFVAAVTLAAIAVLAWFGFRRSRRPAVQKVAKAALPR